MSESEHPLDDLEMWREMIAEVGSWPVEPGKYEIKFKGEPEPFDVTFTCPDCKRTVRARGISFGPDDPTLHLSGHQSMDCKALKNRLWRLRHHTLWRLSQRIRYAFK